MYDKLSLASRLTIIRTAIEICDLNGDDLNALAKKTFILITTVGPYGMYGEHVSPFFPP